MKSNFYISFGLWLMIIPFLGFPGFWKTTLYFLSGLFLVAASLGSLFVRRIQAKPRNKKRQPDALSPEIAQDNQSVTPENTSSNEN